MLKTCSIMNIFTAALSTLLPAADSVHFVGQVNWAGLKFSVTLPQIRLFKRNNSHICFNGSIFDEEDMEVIPEYISKFGKHEKQINFLLLKVPEINHVTF